MGSTTLGFPLAGWHGFRPTFDRSEGKFCFRLAQFVDFFPFKYLSDLLFKVTVGGLAEKAGLCAGDTIVKVNNVDLENMRHKDALDAISRAGSSFDLSIIR